MRDQETFRHLLSALLEQAAYPPELQQQYLAFFTDHIISYVLKFPHWHSNLTHNGSPFEPSRNIQQGQSLLRFCIEPASAVAGTISDPFNQIASLSLVQELGKLDLFKNLDIELWEYFTKEFFIWSTEDIQKISERLQTKDRNLRLRSCLLAFDLRRRESGVMLKGYVNFFRRAIILEKSPLLIICESIKGLDERQHEKLALKKLEQFAASRDGGYEGIRNMAMGNIDKVNGINTVMVSFDFIDRTQSRIKIYARSYDLEFSNFKDIYSLGGQIHIEKEELKVFESFYSALFGLPEHWDGITEQVTRLNHRHAGVLWQFEFKHGKDVPIIKLYISFWNFVPNDVEAARRLKRFFATQSWRLADSYSSEIEQLFGAENIRSAAGRHSYVSFSYTKEKGPYVTLYYAPKLEIEK